jgi:putative membrane protein
MNTHYLKKLYVLPCLAAVMAYATVSTVKAADTTPDNPGQLSASDYKFAKEAAIGGMLEVNLGNIAASNSSTTSVQQFGQKMVRDHGKAGQELNQIAAAKGAALPTELPVRKQREVDKLAQLSGHEFDKAYLAYMIKCHKMDEKAFQHASENLQDPQLRAFAGKTLSTVQMHLKMAEDLYDSTKHEVSVNNQ